MNKTYIVDGNSLLFRSYYSTAYTGNLMQTKEGIPVNAIFAFHNLIKKIKAQLKENDHLFISFDTGKPTFRKQEFEEYKAQRAPAPQELVAQMPIAREMLESMDIYWKELEGYEGDDLAGSMAKYASIKGDIVTLFTSDKDFLQLLDLSENVHICFLKKGLSETIDYTKENLHDLFGLNPNQITDFKGIAGDPSDNYKGIKGVGEKTTMKLLNEHGDLSHILDYCRSNPSSKMCQKILAGEKEACFFKKLATIETTLDMAADYEKSLYSPYHKSKLSRFYHKYQLSQFERAIDRMPGIVDDENAQLSLFSSEEDFKEEPIQKKREITSIHRFDEIKEDVLSMTYDSSSDNENTSQLFSFVFSTKEKTYVLRMEDAKKDDSFKAFLTKEKKLSVYDLKGLLVLLHRYQFEAIKGVDFDLFLATYLLDPDCGQKREDIFNSYEIPYDTKENIAYQMCGLVADIGENVKERIAKNEESNLLTNVEIPLADLLAGMEIEGFPIDKKTLSEINDEYSKVLSSLEKEIYEIAGKEFNINSPKQLETILFTDLHLERNKGEKGTSIEVLKAHIHDSPIIEKIITYRLYSKLVNGYTTALPEHIQEDQKIHALYNQALTATGRLSMSEPNLQNIAIRNEEGKSIRKAFFYPNHEFYLLSLDYSQIELRMLAHVANIQALQEIFKEGNDIHRSTASRVFHVPLEEVTPEMRRKAKAVNFGIVYGISAYGLANQLSISSKEAKELIEQFKKTFIGIDEFQKNCIEKARKNGYVTTILNRRRYLKDINSTNHALRSFSERAATNSVIQGSAADLMKVSMIKCAEVLKNYKTKIILQIHDELIFKVPKEELEIVTPLLKSTMDSAMSLAVPLEVDGNAAFTWYEAH